MQDIEEAKSIIRKLNEKGYEAYLVGGCVRDYLLNISPSDFDIASNARPEEVENVFEHTIPTGKDYGTISVKSGSDYYEVTTYRLESEYSDNRRPKAIKYSTSLKEDLKRRDFTINALAMDIDANIIDYYGGRNDLEDKLIRCVADPIKRFNEDSLRKLRAIRFATQKGFEIEEDTFKCISDNPSLRGVSSERIESEFTKIILSDNASRGIRLLLKSNLLEEFLPEILECVDFNQNNEHHIYDVFDHLCHALDNVESKLEFRLAALMHDIAKVKVYSQDENGVGHFIGHEKSSADMASLILARMRYPSRVRKDVVHLIRYHMSRPVLSEKAVRKFLSKIAINYIEDIMSLFRADALASNPKYVKESLIYIEKVNQIIDKILNEKQALSRKDLEINGRDILNRYHNISGSDIGAVLNHLLSLVMEDPSLNNRETLLKEVDIYIEESMR